MTKVKLRVISALGLSIALVFCVLATTILPAQSAEAWRKKILHLGLEPCQRCTRWINTPPFGRNCAPNGMSAGLVQHQFYLVVNAPDVTEAIKLAASYCGAIAASAAEGAAATAPEIGSKAAAAYASAKTAFWACIQAGGTWAGAGLASMHIQLDHSTGGCS